jgi:hypothetical protein
MPSLWDGEGRLLAFSGDAERNQGAMRVSAVHATLSLRPRGHNWSFSSINSVGPRSRWHLYRSPIAMQPG